MALFATRAKKWLTFASANTNSQLSSIIKDERGSFEEIQFHYGRTVRRDLYVRIMRNKTPKLEATRRQVRLRHEGSRSRTRRGEICTRRFLPMTERHANSHRWNRPRTIRVAAECGKVNCGNSSRRSCASFVRETSKYTCSHPHIPT